MLGSLGQFAVKLANLAEAEGRVARAEAIRLGTALLFGFAATMLALVGVFVISGALYAALANVVAPAWAMLIVGCGLIAIAALVGVVCARLLHKESTR